MDYTPLQADTEYIAHCDGAKQQCNKSNLRDLIAATGLVILLKLNSNRQFFSPCEIEIWWMTSKNYRAPLLHYIKFCASSQTPRWIKTGVTVRKPSIRVKIGDSFCPVWPWKLMDDLEINRAPLLWSIELLWASFQSHQWIQTGVTVRKRSIRVKIGDFFISCDLEIWWMTLKNNRTLLLLSCSKLCALFHSHWWIKDKVTVQKRSIRVKIGNLLSRVTLKFDGWP